jgi:hypothetical protein
MPEQRKHTRFNAPDGALALTCGSTSKVINISKGGISLMFQDDMDGDIPMKLSLDLLSTDYFITARKIPGKLVWEQEVSFSTMSRIVHKKVGVQFGKLSNRQKDQLNKLIMNYTTQSA